MFEKVKTWYLKRSEKSNKWLSQSLLYKFGQHLYHKQIGLVVFIWSLSFFLLFVQENYKSCLGVLKEINFDILLLIVYTVFSCLLLLLIIYFGANVYRLNKKQEHTLKDTLNSFGFGDSTIYILPLFMIMIFTLSKIIVFICKWDISSESKNIFMFMISCTFIYTSLQWYKYMKNANKKVSSSTLLLAILYIFFVCNWNSVLPYISDIINLFRCVLSKI